MIDLSEDILIAQRVNKAIDEAAKEVVVLIKLFNPTVGFKPEELKKETQNLINLLGDSETPEPAGLSAKIISLFHEPKLDSQSQTDRIQTVAEAIDMVNRAAAKLPATSPDYYGQIEPLESEEEVLAQITAVYGILERTLYILSRESLINLHQEMIKPETIGITFIPAIVGSVARGAEIARNYPQQKIIGQIVGIEHKDLM